MFTIVDRERSLAACAVQEKVYKPYCIARYCVNEGIHELAPICQAPLYVRRPYMSGAPICKVTLPMLVVGETPGQGC